MTELRLLLVSVLHCCTTTKHQQVLRKLASMLSLRTDWDKDMNQVTEEHL